jgi:hypothetical protein
MRFVVLREKGKRKREKYLVLMVFVALCNFMPLWLLHLCVCGCRPSCCWFVAGLERVGFG